MPRGSPRSACSAFRRMRADDGRRAGRAQDHRDLPFPAGRSRHRGHPDHVRAPDRLPAALPVLRHRLRVPRRRVVGARGDPRSACASSARACLRHRRRAARAEELPRAAARSSAMRAIACRSRRAARCHSPASIARVVRVVDVKTPGSGEERRNRYERARAPARRTGQVRDLRPRRLRMEPRASCASSALDRALHGAVLAESRAAAAARSRGLDPRGPPAGALPDAAAQVSVGQCRRGK